MEVQHLLANQANQSIWYYYISFNKHLISLGGIYFNLKPLHFSAGVTFSGHKQKVSISPSHKADNLYNTPKFFWESSFDLKPINSES